MGVLSGLCSTAQNLTDTSHDNYDELSSYPNSACIKYNVDVPSERGIKSGGVIRVSYEGDWTNDMKGAFEYACKIWEHELPTTLPLNVVARMENFDDNDAISKSVISRPDFQNRFEPLRSSVSSRIKAVMLMEYDSNTRVQFVEMPESFIHSTDMTFILNSDKLDDISFSLDAVPEDKYDFVTIVLRDLSRLFGIYNAVSTNNGSLSWKWDTPTHFESKLKGFISDGAEGYALATSGSVPISFCGKEVSLYAPNPWQQDVSLNCFIADESIKMTKLLSNCIGKGCMLRDISDENNNMMFRDDLGWRESPHKSPRPRNHVSIDSNGDKRIPFKGRLTVGSAPGHHYSATGRCAMDAEMYDVEQFYDKDATTCGNSAERSFLAPYGMLYDSNTNDNINNGWTVSLLKKDGSWDCVYTSGFCPVLSVNVDELQHHFPLSEYKRTCAGELRCRVVNAQQLDNGGHEIGVGYYVIDELPQMIDMKFSRLAPDQIDDEYLRDVEIGIKNLEGTETLYVEQWIEGDTYPQIYQITDFKKGYFTVTVDKEFYTDLMVTAYNKNGSTESEIYRLEPLEPADFEYGVSIGDDSIELTQPQGRRASRGKTVQYQIFAIDTSNARILIDGSVTIGESPIIDISSLGRGLYGLRYTDAQGQWESIKFMKK